MYITKDRSKFNLVLKHLSQFLTLFHLLNTSMEEYSSKVFCFICLSNPLDLITFVSVCVSVNRSVDYYASAYIRERQLLQSPKWFPLPEIVPFELYPNHKHPRKYPFSVVFGTCKTPCGNSEVLNGLCMQTPIHVFYLKKCSKSVQDKWPKVRVVLVTEKKQNTFWHP